jgi:hypothetical protein
MKTNIHFLSYPTHFFLELEMFQTNVVEKIKTYILCAATFLENRAVYEKMWKNILERDRPQITIWRTRIACWVPKATNTHTHSGCVIHFVCHSSNGGTNAPQCNVRHTLPVLFIVNPGGT